VELLIDAEIFFELLSVGQIKLGSHHSSIQKTLLVYIVSGKYTQQALNSATHLSETVKRLASGRFEVKLPFKRNPNVVTN